MPPSVASTGKNAAEEPKHASGGEAPHAAPGSWVAPFRQYLVGSYVPTLMHALFHLMGVLLAFIMASAWNARENDLRDVGVRLALLTALQREAHVLYDSLVDARLREPLRQKEVQASLVQRRATAPGPAANANTAPLVTCEGAFFVNAKTGERRFKTPRWDGLSTRDRASIIEEPYQKKIDKTAGAAPTSPARGGVSVGEQQETYADKIDHTYTGLDEAAAESRLRSGPDCVEMLQTQEKALQTLSNELQDGVDQAADYLKNLRDHRFWPPRFDMYIGVTLTLWLAIILSPVLIVGGKLAWRDRRFGMDVARLYLRLTGAALVGLIAVLAFAGRVGLNANTPILYTALDVVAGAIGIYVGFLGPAAGARMVSQLFGVLFTVLGLVGLIAQPAMLGSVPGLPHTAYGVFHLMIGLLGFWTGFQQRARRSAAA